MIPPFQKRKSSFSCLRKISLELLIACHAAPRRARLSSQSSPPLSPPDEYSRRSFCLISLAARARACRHCYWNILPICTAIAHHMVFCLSAWERNYGVQQRYDILGEYLKAQRNRMRVRGKCCKNKLARNVLLEIRYLGIRWQWALFQVKNQCMCVQFSRFSDSNLPLPFQSKKCDELAGKIRRGIIAQATLTKLSSTTVQRRRRPTKSLNNEIQFVPGQKHQYISWCIHACLSWQWVRQERVVTHREGGAFPWWEKNYDMTHEWSSLPEGSDIATFVGKEKIVLA